MPKGPRGQKRPADVVGNAIKAARIATGEDQKDMPVSKKDPNAAALGKKGGVARAKALSAEKRSEIAKKAARSRWRARS